MGKWQTSIGLDPGLTVTDGKLLSKPIITVFTAKLLVSVNLEVMNFSEKSLKYTCFCIFNDFFKQR